MSARRPVPTREALSVLLLLLGWVALLYRGAFGIGVLSDGWALLGIGAQGFAKAPTVLLGYHSIPVTNLFMAALWRAFGLNPWAYQAVNLAELAIVAWLLYLLARDLELGRAVGLTASLLLVANVSFYEVPLWPTVGNFQSLAAMLYLVGAAAALRLARGERPWVSGAVFALATVTAFYTYEPAFSLLPVGILAAPIFGREGTGARRARPLIAAALATAAMVAAGKVYAAAHGSSAAFLPTDWPSLTQRLHYMVRATIGLFSLRGADYVLYKLMTLGLPAYPGTWRFHAVVASWLVALATAGTMIVVKSTRPAMRWLVIWLALHLLTVSAATVMVSRHFYLAALPASLLAASGLWWFANWAAQRAAFWPAAVRGAIVGGVFLVLLLASRADLRNAVEVALQATTASRHVLLAAQEVAPTGPDSSRTASRLTLINMPAVITRQGVSTFAFVNGLHQMVSLGTNGRVTRPDLRLTYNEFRDGEFANGSQVATLASLHATVERPGNVTLCWNPSTHDVDLLTAVNFPLPSSYTPASTPYMAWQAGSPSRLRLYARKPLELPLAVSAAKMPWAALRYAPSAGAHLRIRLGSAATLATAPDAAAERASWPVYAAPIATAVENPSRVDLTVEADTETALAGVWTFEPPTSYTPESAPYLDWAGNQDPSFSVVVPLSLPLAALPPGSRWRLQYLAVTDAGFGLTLDGQEIELGPFDGGPGDWRPVDLPGDGRQAVLSIRPRGPRAARVRQLAPVPFANDSKR
ncbi:MAG: hypothetical protein ABI609_13865 [Acidobacteriota bacterium]